MTLARLALPTILGFAALATTIVLSTRNADAAPQGDKTSKDAVISRVEGFLSGLSETSKRTALIDKMCEGGPIDGLKQNKEKISELADTEITRFGQPVGGADGIALAEEKVISNFFCARTYVVRLDRGPSVWHVLLYNGNKGWGVSELGIAPNAHCLIDTWRDFTVVPVRQNTPQAAPASGTR
jgi:hypothetical protein